MKKALFAGSFDPVTNGHLDVIKKASTIFDKLYLGIAFNPEKKYFFNESTHKTSNSVLSKNS